MLKVSFTSARTAKNKAIALCVAKDGKLGEEGKKLDKQLGGALGRSIKATPSFTGKKGQTLLVRAPSKSGPSLVVLIGVGAPESADEAVFEKAGALAFSTLSKDAEGEAVFIADRFAKMLLEEGIAAQHGALGAQLASYSFTKYKSKTKKPASKLKAIACVIVQTAETKGAYKEMQAVAEGVAFARDLVSEPANVMDPDAMKEAALGLQKLGVKVKVLDEKEMAALGMNSLLCVGQGSANPSYLVTMTWNGADKESEKPVAFVGKGVTFDTGGISLKPGANMWDMKFDMGGAAAVLGAMKALALRKAKTNAVGVIGLVENMPSGTAIKPGDVVKSASGQTIEVLNTDAEGRLVLADALWYAQKYFKPKAIIDLATLTGAMIVALGNKYAGLFSNDDDLAFALSAAGEKTSEPVWRMPLHKDYDKLIDSPIADVKNIGEGGAGSITAAQFLQRFVAKKTAWAHLDIAGTVWDKKGSALCPKGATGYGVRLLNQFVADFAEPEEG